MTPSPEARQIVEMLIAAGYSCTTMHARSIARDIESAEECIDEALAPHRERVRRLVEAAREARKRLAGHAYIEADPRQLIQTRDRASDDVKRIHANLDAALAPFLEQETTP